MHGLLIDWWLVLLGVVPGLFLGYFLASDWGREQRLRILVWLYGRVVKLRDWWERRKRGGGGNGRIA